MLKEPRYDRLSQNSILEHAMLLLGKSLRSLYPDECGAQATGKGKLGQCIEKYHFGYTPNSNSAPDFPEAGLELKSTPLKELQDGSFVSKERLVLNIVDYIKEGEVDKFEDSSFWRKNKALLLLFYLYEADKSYLDFIFRLIRIWNFPESDLRIIRNDWETIHRKICEGKAHELSEGDTLFLGVCPKGSKAGANMREQYVEKAPLAQQRAYSLKSVYINAIIADSLLHSEMVSGFAMTEGCRVKLRKQMSDKMSAVTSDYEENETFEHYIIRQFEQYYGLTLKEISQRCGRTINFRSKSYAYDISKMILQVEADKKIDEFEKADLQIKTINLEANGNLKESMSFANIKYREIVDEQWEESYLHRIFTNRFLFIVFQKSEGNNQRDSSRLKQVFFWGMPWHDLEKVHTFWEDTKQKIVKNDFTHFLKSSEHEVCHVRPKGRDSNDLMLTISNTWQKKYCYWLNRQYVLNIIKENISD